MVSEIISGIGTAGGLYIAWQGLSTWKKQLKGNTEYELSRRIIISTLKLKNAIDAHRHPAIFSNEMPLPPEDDPRYVNYQERNYYGTFKAYETRWDRVQEASIALRTDILEGEVLWGNIFKEQFNKLFDLQHELFMATRNYLDAINPQTDKESKKALREIQKSTRDVMYDRLTDKLDDAFKDELNEEIKKIREYLKPKIAH